MKQPTETMRTRTAATIAKLRHLTRPEPGCKACERAKRACRRHAGARVSAMEVGR